MIDISYSISADTLSIAEGNSGSQALTFTVTRSGAIQIQDASSIDYTISGSASSGVDYNNIGGSSGAAGLSGTISFAAGEEEKTITLHMVGDTTFERNESITISLSNATAPNGTATISTAAASSTIINDDAAPPARDLTDVVFTAGPDLAISIEGWRLESVIQTLEGDDIIIGESISLGAGSAGFGRSGTLDTGAGNDSITATTTKDSTFALSINILSKIIAGSGNDSISGLSKGFSGYGLSSSGLIDTGDGDDTITGESNGSKDVFSGGSAISNTGTIETGIGNDSITTSGIWSYGFLSFGMTKTGSGNDSITSTVTGYHSAIRNANSSQSLGVIDTGSGSDSITASSNGTAIDNDGSITTGDGNDSITGFSTGSRQVLDKDYSYGYGIISYDGTIDTGNGNDTITGAGWGLGGFGIFCSNRIDTGSGNDVVDALVGGFAGRGLINLGDGDDTLKGFGFVTQWGTGLFDAGLGSDRLLIGEAGTYTISAQADQAGFYSLSKDSNLMLIKSFEFLGNANDGTQFAFAPGTSFTIAPATPKIVFSSIHTIVNVSLGSTQLGYAIKVGSTNPIQITDAGTYASPNSPGGGWSAIAAAANGTGFDLYLKNTNGSYEIWNLNGGGIQSGSKVITATEFYAAEASLSNDLNGDGFVGNPFAAMKTVGSVALGSNANGYALKTGSANPIQITYADNNASPTSPGGGWSAIAAAANGTGFDLYLKNTSGSYGLWSLDGAGVLTGNKPLSVSEFYAAEMSLSNDLNGDGSVGNPVVVLTPLITLAVSPASMTEDGTANFVYTFTRTGTTSSSLTVNYTVSGTATFGTDYTGISATDNTKSIILAIGSSTATLTVDPSEDTSIETDETVALTLAAGSGYTIGTMAAVVGTILNDDLPVITLAVAPSAGVSEDGTVNLLYTFTRTGFTTAALTVNYTVGGTATLGTDYSGIAAIPVTKTVSFAANSATAIVTVDPTADAVIEPNETVALTLAAGSGYTIGTTTAVIGTISNDDSSVTLAVAPATVTEDGSTNLLYTFTRTGFTTNALSVNYTIAGTADSSDYTGVTPGTGKTITFAAGASTATLTIDPTADNTVESNETVALTLAAGSGYTIGTTAAVVGTITNDDLLTPSPSSTTTIYSGRFATPNEVDSYSVDVAPGTIISASITTPSQQSLYPLINLFDASSSLLKGPLAYAKDFADLGMFDVITGKATLKVGTQTGFLGDYELSLSFINREAVKNEVVSLTNAQRLQAGLNPLTRNLLLESAAQAHVADMDASNRYLAHTGSNGSDPVTRIAATGYKGGWVDLGNGQLRTISSENAAAGQKTPAEVVNAWMNSPGHRAATMDRYTKEIGIGFEFDNEVGDITAQSYKIGTTYWVQNFGHPWQTGMQVWF